MVTGKKRIGMEEKHTFFVTLNWQEIRNLEELAYRDQAAQGRDGQRGCCSWWWLGVTLWWQMRNFACTIQHHFNMAMKEHLPLPFFRVGGRAGVQTPTNPPLDSGAAVPEGSVAAWLCTPEHVCPSALPPICICVHFNKKTHPNTQAPSS